MKSNVEKVAKELGSLYTVKTIDFERCVYRDLGNGVDFEISGLGRKHKMDCTLFVWGPKESFGRIHVGIIDQVSHIGSLEQLKSVLARKAAQYLNMYPRSDG